MDAARLLHSYDNLQNKTIWYCCNNIAFGEAFRLALHHRPIKILSKRKLHTENEEIISKQYLSEELLSKVRVCQGLVGGDGFHFPTISVEESASKDMMCEVTAEHCASDIGFVNPTKIEANVKYARIVEHKQKHYAWLKLEVHSYRQGASPKRPLETAPRAEISCAAKAATASSEPRTPGSSKRGRIVTTALKPQPQPQPQPQACSSLRQLTSMSTDWQWRRFPHRRNRCCASAGRGTQSRSCTTYASCSPAKTNQARICS